MGAEAWAASGLLDNWKALVAMKVRMIRTVDLSDSAEEKLEH